MTLYGEYVLMYVYRGRIHICVSEFFLFLLFGVDTLLKRRGASNLLLLLLLLLWMSNVVVHIIPAKCTTMLLLWWWYKFGFQTEPVVRTDSQHWCTGLLVCMIRIDVLHLLLLLPSSSLLLMLIY